MSYPTMRSPGDTLDTPAAPGFSVQVSDLLGPSED